VMRPRTVTCNPFSGRNRSSFADERDITTRICADSSFSVKYKWPESGMRRLEISPSTQQSEYSRSMCDRTAETRARTVQTRRSGGRNWNPSWSTISIQSQLRSFSLLDHVGTDAFVRLAERSSVVLFVSGTITASAAQSRKEQ